MTHYPEIILTSIRYKLPLNVKNKVTILTITINKLLFIIFYVPNLINL